MITKVENRKKNTNNSLYINSMTSFCPTFYKTDDVISNVLFH